MIVFVDFEASSLAKASFPVEVAWVFQNGAARTSLIRPASGWDDWSADAESIHGISKSLLETEGVPVEIIAKEMVESLSDHQLYASAPSWDGKWLSVLLRAAGFPRHALRLNHSHEAFADAARAILGHDIADVVVAELVSTVVKAMEPAVAPHRALPDARLELERWQRIQKEAASLALK
ncbi:transcriptional regulator [Ensifer sp. IC4062]|nr:transcriptional regulator [Ensifer sp. IC4062]MCA1440218.1 transcriptional regulator [Ensifer sp. IC4062]